MSRTAGAATRLESRLRIVFLGNHTVGVRTLAALCERDDVVGVVAHPPDPEDGVRYESVYQYACARGLEVVRLPGGNSAALRRFVSDCRPELLWLADYRYLLPPDVVALAPYGAVNLHPSLLPSYRGRAPLNWAILNGERELGLTAHFVDEGIDSGDIIEQVRFDFPAECDVGDALQILYPLYQAVTRRVLECFHGHSVPRRAQDHRCATVYPRRRPEDGLIDWCRPARRVRDLVRAVARPYPGAFSFHGGRKVLIWLVALDEHVAAAEQPGRVLACRGGAFIVQAGDGAVVVREATCAATGRRVSLEPGVGFSSEVMVSV